mmetsp:Transcript_2076/g.3267  ORF Transcript_2076/g.3267 Transcript_2076/m.3267 type:complete len:88 (+) Transcript_2076:700-963(+)
MGNQKITQEHLIVVTIRGSSSKGSSACSQAHQSTIEGCSYIFISSSKKMSCKLEQAGFGCRDHELLGLYNTSSGRIAEVHLVGSSSS